MPARVFPATHFRREAARDLTAETMAQAFQHRARFRGTTEAEAAGWLYGIARHQLNRYVRRGVVHRKAVERLGIRIPAIGEDDYSRIVELAELSEMREQVAAAFAALTSDQQRALQLRVVEERPYADVASALGVSEQTARARVSRGLCGLGDALELSMQPEVTP